MATRKKTETTTAALDELMPTDGNPKRHAAEGIKASLRRFGYVSPIVVDDEGGVIAGHGRLDALLALRAAGEKPPKGVGEDWSVLCRVYRPRNNKERRAYLLADNQLTIAGGWDDAQLAEMLTGFDASEILSLGFSEGSELESRDTAPQPAPGNPKSQLGDIWKLGDHLLVCGSSANTDTVKRSLRGRAFDLMVTDPPYGVSYVGKTKDKLTIQNDDMSPLQTEELWVQFLTVAHEQAAAGAAYYVFGPTGDHLERLMRATRKAGWGYKHGLVWVKSSLVFGGCDYHYQHETILYGWKEGRHYFGGGRKQTSVWEAPKPAKSEYHPTMKPVELYVKAYRNSSKPGGLVFEPFCGSGTALIAAEETGRQCAAIELDPGYVDVAIKRWEDHTGQAAVLDGRMKTPPVLESISDGEDETHT